MDLISQIFLLSALRHKGLDLLQFINSTSLEPTRIMENKPGVASKGYLILNIMDSTLNLA